MESPPAEVTDDLPPLRREVADSLRRHASDLAELYEGALRILSEAHFPGKVRFVAHAIREIVNRLPDAMGAPRAAHIQYQDLCDKIENDWRKHGLPSDGTLPPDPESGSNPKITDVKLPRSVYLKMGVLVRTHAEGRDANDRRWDRLFEMIEPDDPAAEARFAFLRREWRAIGRLAVGRAHVPATGSDISNRPSPPSDDSTSDEDMVKGCLERLEAALGAFFREFFKTTDELDKILEEANS